MALWVSQPVSDRAESHTSLSLSLSFSQPPSPAQKASAYGLMFREDDGAGEETEQFLPQIPRWNPGSSSAHQAKEPGSLKEAQRQNVQPSPSKNSRGTNWGQYMALDHRNRYYQWYRVTLILWWVRYCGAFDSCCTTERTGAILLQQCVKSSTVFPSKEVSLRTEEHVLGSSQDSNALTRSFPIPSWKQVLKCCLISNITDELQELLWYWLSSFTLWLGQSCLKVKAQWWCSILIGTGLFLLLGNILFLMNGQW